MAEKRKAAINNKLLEVLDQIVEGRAEDALKWLDEIANGKPTLGKDGKAQLDSQGNPLMQTKGNPVLAFELWQSMLEYRVPKLARTEVTGNVRVQRAEELTDDELADIVRGRRSRATEAPSSKEKPHGVH